MSRVLFGKQALAELEQLIDGLAQQDRQQAFAMADAIAEATGALEHSPLLGSPLPGGMHQLNIAHNDSQLLALYRYLALEDRVEILLLRPRC